MNPHSTHLLKGGHKSEGGAQQRLNVIDFKDFNFLGLSSLFPVNIRRLPAFISGLCTFNQLLSFLRFFSVQEDVLARLPVPTSPTGSAEGLQAGVHLSTFVLSMG